MKKTAIFLLVIMICTVILSGWANNDAATGADVVKDILTVQAFTDEAVDDADIEAIVAAGINAPSAINSQPWHFTVITNRETLDTLSSGGFGGAPGGRPDGANAPEGMPSFGGMPEGMTPPSDMPDGAAPSFDGMPPFGGAPGGTGTGSAKAGMGDAPLVIVVSCSAGSDLDAGLATQNMSAEAQLLGYGTKILSSPKLTLNSDENKSLLGVPDGMSVVCVLLVGKTETDGYDAVASATVRNDASETVTYLK